MNETTGQRIFYGVYLVSLGFTGYAFWYALSGGNHGLALLVSLPLILLVIAGIKLIYDGI